MLMCRSCALFVIRMKSAHLPRNAVQICADVHFLCVIRTGIRRMGAFFSSQSYVKSNQPCPEVWKFKCECGACQFEAIGAPIGFASFHCHDCRAPHVAIL